MCFNVLGAVLFLLQHFNFVFQQTTLSNIFVIIGHNFDKIQTHFNFAPDWETQALLGMKLQCLLIFWNFRSDFLYDFFNLQIGGIFIDLIFLPLFPEFSEPEDLPIIFVHSILEELIFFWHV